MSTSDIAASHPESLIDSLVFHDWASTADLSSYLSPGWRELLIRPGDRTGDSRVRSQPLYTRAAFPVQTSICSRVRFCMEVALTRSSSVMTKPF